MSRNLYQFLQICSALFFLLLLFQVNPSNAQAESVDDVIANAPDGISLENAFNLVPVGSNSHAKVAKNRNGNDVCVLTDDNKDQRAALWSATNYKLSLNKDFKATMKLYLGNKGSNAADGITFTLQNDPRGNAAFNQSDEGGSLGVYGRPKEDNAEEATLHAIHNSFSIEFDTHKNDGNGNAYDEESNNYQPGDNHIAATLPGSAETYDVFNDLFTHKVKIRHNLLTEPINLNNGALSNGQWHDFAIQYDHTSNLLTYTFDGTTRSCTLPISVLTNSSNTVYWGFTGTTGSDSTVNAVVFSELPKPVSVETKTDVLKNNISVVNKTVNTGDTLTYILDVKYLGGIQNWTDVIPEEFLNKYVDYIPKSLVVKYPDTGTEEKVEPTITADHHLLVPPLSHDLGDVQNNQWTSAEIRFNVKVKTVDTEQEKIEVKDYTEFLGDNYTVQPYETDYEIINTQALAPEIKLDDSLANQTIYMVPAIKELNLNGQWKDKDSDLVSLYYKVNGQVFPLQENIPNNTKDSWTTFYKKITFDTLHLGDNSVEVFVKDDQGHISNLETFVIALQPGEVKFALIDPIIQFSNQTLSGQLLHSSPMASVGVQITDTIGDPTAWRLTVNQIDAFANSEHQLAATLTYHNAGQALDITNNGPVALPVVQKDGLTYRLAQDTDHSFDLAISSGAYAGNYQSKLEWTIVEAP